VRLVTEVADDLGAGNELGVAEAVEAAGGGELGEALEEISGDAAGAQRDAHAAVAVAVRELGVRGAGRHLHRLPGTQDVVDAVELEVHRALDHLVALGRPDVHVLGGDEAAGAPDHVELEHLVVGPAHLDAHAQRRHFQNVP
jgi:hypothetical protein